MKSKTKTIAATSLLITNTISTIKAQETQQNEPTSKKILAKTVKTSSYQRSSKNDNNSDKKTKTSSSTPPSPPFSSSSTSFFSWMQDENATYLDVFGEVTKDILTNQIIPETTALCDWNWMHLRCEPFCHCSYQPLWGDYHLGRSCRARRGRVEEEEDAWDRSEGDDGKSNDWNQEVFLQTCQNPPNTMVYKGMKGIGNGLEFVWNKINWRVRVESARNQMCDTLFQAGVVAGASTISRERGQGKGEEGDDDGVDDDNDELNSGDPSRHYLLEKPVRALRKSLHCNYKSRNSVLVSNLQRKETSHVPENLSDTRRANGMDSGKKVVVVVKEEEDAVVDTFTTTLLKTDALSSTTKI
jgi:hypothetical protein